MKAGTYHFVVEGSASGLEFGALEEMSAVKARIRRI